MQDAVNYLVEKKYWEIGMSTFCTFWKCTRIDLVMINTCQCHKFFSMELRRNFILFVAMIHQDGHVWFKNIDNLWSVDRSNHATRPLLVHVALLCRRLISVGVNKRGRSKYWLTRSHYRQNLFIQPNDVPKTRQGSFYWIHIWPRSWPQLWPSL